VPHRACEPGGWRPGRPAAWPFSLAAWTALWGIPGAFHAVPTTACIDMVLAEFQGTRPIAILLWRHRDLGKAS